MRATSITRSLQQTGTELTALSCLWVLLQIPSPVAVLAVLRVPFYRAASTVLVVGIAVQTAVLLEQETADRVGTWLNR